MHDLGPMQVSLGPGVLPDAVTGIHFHCLLAWPTLGEAAEFQRVADEMIAGSLRMSLKEGPLEAEELAARWPHLDWLRYMRQARSKRRVGRGTMDIRIRRRMAAARMALGILHEEIFGSPADLPPGITDTSLDQLSDLVRSDTSIADPENVEKLAWRSSLPIIHVAMGTALEIRARSMRDGILAAEGSSSERFDVRIDDIGFYRSATERAQRLEPIIRQHRRFRTAATNLTVVRWFE